MLGENVARYHTNGFGANLTADGSDPGLVTIADTADFVVGMRVWLSSSLVAGVRAMIKEIPSGTTLRLSVLWDKDSASGDYRLLDTTPYLLADGARIDVTPQVVIES